MSSGSGLPPFEHAAFAVASRLISCLVTEKILRALYLPIHSPQVAGLLVILSTDVTCEPPVINRALRSGDIFALVPLRHPPIYHRSPAYQYQHGHLVHLVDPLDMYPAIFELSTSSSILLRQQEDLIGKILACLASPSWELGHFTTVAKITDPVYLWNKFVHSFIIQDALRNAIEKEIQSSFNYQLLAYLHPPKCPSLTSPPIEWEQSLVAGHPTHPMHRAREILSPNVHNYDWYHPWIRFARVPRSHLDISGPFEHRVRTLAELAARNSGNPIPDDLSSVYVPIHELQAPIIRQKFPDVEILHPDIGLQGLAQASIRTVIVSELPGMALKLAIGVKISSSLRTISHFTAKFGPRFSVEVIPHISIDRSILFIAQEPASAVHKSADPDVAKHLTAILREEPQPKEGETLIICAALPEMDHAGAPVGISAVEHIFNLDTPEKRAAFLDRYLLLACQALLPPLIKNGLAFEAHAQNLLARFDVATGRLLGFVVRDLGGLRVHPETLRQSTGVNFQFLPGHCVATETLQEIYHKFYHTFVHNHVQRLIRVLKMHHDGRGWEILRRYMDALIPADHALRKIWLSPNRKTVLAKSLMRMRMQDLYRDMIFHPVPNMILHRGDEPLDSDLFSPPCV